MRRLFWIGLGAAAAVVVVVQGRKVLRRLTLEGVAEQVEEQVTDLVGRARAAASTFAEARREREAELTEALLGERDVAEARRVRAEHRARRAEPDQDDEDVLGYSFF